MSEGRFTFSFISLSFDDSVLIEPNLRSRDTKTITYTTNITTRDYYYAQRFTIVVTIMIKIA